MSKNLPSNVSTVKSLLESKKKELTEALPKHIPAEKLIRIFVTQLSTNPKLQECTQQSLIGALLQSCLYGLEPDGREAALVPYWNGKLKVTEAKLITMVRGEVKLVRQSGEVADIYAEVVHKNDKFSIQKGLNRDLKHEPNYEDPGVMIGAYAVYILKSGEKGFEYMPLSEIHKRRDVSKTSGSGPWQDWPEEMAKKTVLKHLLKFAPSSVDKSNINTDVLPDTGYKILDTLKLSTPEQEAQAGIEAPRRKSEAAENVDTDTGEISESEVLDDESEAALAAQMERE